MDPIAAGPPVRRLRGVVVLSCDIVVRGMTIIVRGMTVIVRGSIGYFLWRICGHEKKNSSLENEGETYRSG